MNKILNDDNLLNARILIIGLGSMGKRRIRNLKHLGITKIYGHDIRPDRNEEAHQNYGIQTYETFDSAVAEKPDILIVSTPPDEHVSFGIWSVNNQVPFFFEASVTIDGIPELIDMLKEKNVIGVPSCTPRFHPSIRKMKEIIASGELGTLLSFSHHYGSCYANWHPWEDYRDVYFSKTKTGAGRESVTFEMEWLQWLFGEFDEIFCIHDKRLDLEPDIQDTYQICTKGKNGVLGNVFIEVTSPYYFQMTKAIFSDGVMVWDIREKKLFVYKKETDSMLEFPEPEPIVVEGYKFEENMYIEEMRYFLGVLKGERPIEYTLEDDLKVLNLLLMIEQSNKERRSIKVNP